jgi:hypothetical protein
MDRAGGRRAVGQEAQTPSTTGGTRQARHGRGEPCALAFAVAVAAQQYRNRPDVDRLRHAGQILLGIIPRHAKPRRRDAAH